MAIKIDEKEKCCGCHSCSQICPMGCISMTRDDEGFLYPVTDTDKCVECGLCESVCPIISAQPAQLGKETEAFAAVNQDEAVRYQSSSGGVFSLLAENTLEQGGAVFGAAMSDDCREVIHTEAENGAGLSRLRGSKYLQSVIGDSFIRVRDRLEGGQKVLFSGTPCQVEGLKAFLRKDYDNLLCVDIICHGVPSPAIWQKYLSDCEKAAGAKAVSVKFRHKEPGWKNYTVKIMFENGTAQTTEFFKDPFMQAFLKNACLRPSCHECSFKKLNRVSDLTVADFWGIEKICPEMDDNKGTSLVLLHTEKGRMALEAVKKQLRTEKVDASGAIAFNPPATESCRPHPKRAAFMKSTEAEAFTASVSKYLKEKRTFKMLIRAVLQRLGILGFIKKLLGK